MNFDRSIALRPRLHALIPGGAHTYAKCDDQYPEGMAPVIVRGQGSHVWDVDGNEFIEYGAGLRAVSLGHAYPSVIEAVQRSCRWAPTSCGRRRSSWSAQSCSCRSCRRPTW